MQWNIIAQETLEAELRALESEVGDIETLKGIATWRPGNGGEWKIRGEF